MNTVRIRKTGLVSIFVIVSIFILQFSGIVHASQWAKTYEYDIAYTTSIGQTTDSKYVMAGQTTFPDEGYDSTWVMKLGSGGNIEWQKAYGGSVDDYVYSMSSTVDNGCIVAGNTLRFSSYFHNAWVMKLDTDGNIEWQKAYGGNANHYTASIKQTSDEGYITVGWINYACEDMENVGNCETWQKAWVMKLDSDGNIEWQKAYGGSVYYGAHRIEQTQDGGYIVVGTIGLGPDTNDAWVMKLDSEGNIEWQKAYGGNQDDLISSIEQTSDGGYIMAGETNTDYSDWISDLLVVKLDSEGNIQWQKAYGGNERDIANSILQTSDSGYIVLAHWTDGISLFGTWTMKIDSNGSIQWQKSYGNSYDARSMQLTPDGGFIISGAVSSMYYQFSKVLKVDHDGNIPGCLNDASSASMIPASVTASDTGAIGENTNVFIQTTTAAAIDINATVTEVCYYEPPAPPTIGYSPTSFSFTANQGGSNPSNQTLSISNTGGGTLSWSVSDDASWLSLNPTSGTNSGNVSVSVNIAGLTAGTYNALIIITATGATNTPVNIPVTLTINLPPPTVTLLSPNGSEVIPSGSTYAVQWEAPPEAVKFTLRYSINNGLTWKRIAINRTGTSYDWHVPALSNNKTKCLVGVIGFNSSGTKVGEDQSDSTFTIEVVKLTSPDGWETLTSGSTHTITWRTNATIRPVASVKLFRTMNGGSTWTLIKTLLTGNPGSYNWKVPLVTVPKTQCKVKVVLRDSGGVTVGSDISDGVFTIQP